MTTELPSKISVETTPFGSFGLSILPPNSYPWDEDNAQTIVKDIQAILNTLIGEKGIPGSGLTRLVVFTGDLPTEAARWQRYLGICEETSTDTAGIVAGKTFVWGNGEIKSTYGVIILAEFVGTGLLLESDDLRGEANSIIAHELVHVHDRWKDLEFFGEDRQLENDWDGIPHVISKVIWGEYFAESIASAYKPRKGIDHEFSQEGNPFFLTLFQNCIVSIRDEIAAYRTHRDVQKLWNLATSQISKTLNQLGRSLGVITAIYGSSSTQMKLFLKRIAEILPVWGEIAVQINVELQNLAGAQEWTPDRYNELANILKQIFHAHGLYPEARDEGLWINVP